ncbi:MAG TPA: HdeA/HdeB family chaperone [Pseudolabrys sp.]|nr:HdeA/HdeB family chaperone [Pseudolabrys sp.]
MPSTRMWIFCAAIVAAAAAVTTAGHAQESGDRAIEQFTCKDVMRDNGSNRDVAIAFLHGYLVGKSGSAKFNIETLRKQSDQFIELCLDNPHEKAIDVMAKVKK